MTCFVGVDVGATWVKSALLDLDALAVRHVGKRPVPSFVQDQPAGWRELDPVAVVDAVRGEIERVCAVEPRATGLVLCGQMHAVVLVDADGRPHTNAITWQDVRTTLPDENGTSSFERVERSVASSERLRLGNELRPGLPIVTLAWLAEKGQLPPGLLPSSLLDFVVASLCGQAPTTDPTNAAAHGAYDMVARRWSMDVLHRLGLGTLRWPEIRRSGDPVGELLAPQGRLICHTPIGDHQAALLGAGLRPGELSVNVGTGSQVSVIAVAPTTGEHQLRPWFDDRCLHTFTHLPAGRALRVLAGLVGELAESAGMTRDAVWERALARAIEVGETDLEAQMSFFPTRYGREGSIHGMREDNVSVGHLFAAALQSMASNYEECARKLDPEGRVVRIVFSGGLAHRATLLRERLARRLGLPARLSLSAEETLVGLVVLASVASGRAATFDEAARALYR